MKVIQKPGVYEKERECTVCHAIFLVEESDVKIGKFADDYRSESYDRAYFECSFCGNHNVLEDFSRWRLDKLKQQKQKGNK